MEIQNPNYRRDLKARVSREALKDTKTIGDLALEYKVPAYTILKWKKELMYDIPKVYNEPVEKEDSKTLMDKLNSKINKLEKEKNLYKTTIEKYDL